MKKRAISAGTLLPIAFLFHAAPISAQEPVDLFKRKPSVEALALVKVIGAQNLMMPSTQQLTLSIFTPILPLNPGHNAEVFEGAQTSLKLIRGLHMYEAFAPQLANIFDLSFPASEIDGLRHFYETALGAKFAYRQSVINAQIVYLGNNLFETRAGYEALVAGLNELHARGWSVPAPNPYSPKLLPPDPRPSPEAVALLDIIGVGNLMQPMARQYVRSIFSMMHALSANRTRDPKPADIPDAEGTVLAKLEDTHAYEVFAPYVAKFYDVSFAAPELRALAKFLRAEVGSNFVDKQREISERILVLSGMLVGTREGMAAIGVGVKNLQDKGLNVGAFGR